MNGVVGFQTEGRGMYSAAKLQATVGRSTLNKLSHLHMCVWEVYQTAEDCAIIMLASKLKRMCFIK